MDRTVLEFAGCRVDLARHEVRRDGGVTPLTATEARLLGYLAERAGRTVPRDDLLQDVFGYRPGLRSRTLDTTVHRLRDKVEVDPAHPDHLKTVYGIGYRLDVGDDDLPGLVGRTADLRRLRSAVEASGRVTLVGPGGVGKTTLARRLLGDGDVFVDLSSAGDVDAVLRRIRDALDLDEVDGLDGAVAAIRAAVRRHRGRTIVLDNVEQVATAVGALLERLGLPGVRWVATSRRPLSYADEHLVELTPLSVQAATRLFLERADRAGMAAAPGAEVVASLVDALDRLPLAIEMAAARTALLSPHEILARLADRLTLLRSEDRTLQTAIAWSVRLLGPAEQDVLTQIAWFEGGFTLDDAARVVQAEALVDALDALRAWHLLRVIPGDTTRFALYESVRTYAREALPAHPDSARRHAAWGVAVARAGTLHTGRSRLGDAQRPDVLRVLDDLVAAAWRVTEPDAAGEATTTAVELLLRTSGLDTALRLLDRLDALVPDPDPVAAATRLMLRGQAHHLRGQTDRVAPCVTRALALLRGRSEPAILLARLEVLDAAVAQRTGRPIDALDPYARAADHAARANNASLLAMILANRASVLHQLGRIEDALAETEGALAIAEGADDAELVGIILVNRGGMESELRRLDRALPTLRRALALLGPERRSSAVMHLRATLADLHREVGDTAVCLEESGPMLADLAAFGDRRLQALARMNLASALQEMQLLDDAVDEAERAWAFVSPGDAYTSGGVHAQRGALFHERGWPERAEEEYLAALRDLEGIGETRQRAIVLGRLAALAAEAGRGTEAVDWLDRAASLGARGDPATTAAMALHRAHLAVFAGDPAPARRLLRGPAPWAPTVEAWSWDVRLARRLLQAAVDRRGR